MRTIAVLPDPQIGFRRLDTGEMIPMHDPAAMDAALRVVAASKATEIINLGDLLDLSEWASDKFVRDPEFTLTTQPALDEAHMFLARQRTLADDVKLLDANHEKRMANAIAKNAMAALRLRPAATPPDHWPVLSIPFLLRLDDLGIEYVPGYPAVRVKVCTGNAEQSPLIAVHGEKLDLAKLAKAERQSVIQGHIHRVGRHIESYEIDGVCVEVEAISPGCLCRIDGAVPSTRSGTDPFGRPIKRWENWQQGAAIITEHEDGSWSTELVRIRSGVAYWRGKAYEASSSG